jgi:Phage tail sheath C-terminal domain
MAQLNSPGVAVTVIDESFYAPAAPSTVPFILVASEENKKNAANTGIATGTLKANAGKAYLITSQRDLAETFGTPIFKTDANSNPIHAGEQNEYGLQAAYSLLGVSNRAYVVRADIDLKALNARAEAPTAEPESGTYWLDTANSSWGIFEWNNAPRSNKLGQKFTAKTPIVITDTAKVVNYADGDYTPKTSVGVNGDYAIVSLSNLNTDYNAPDVLYFKSSGGPGVDAGQWVVVGSEEWSFSWPTITATLTNAHLLNGKKLSFNGQPDITFVSQDDTMAEIAAKINNVYDGNHGIRADVKNNVLVIYMSNAIYGSFTISGDACPVLGIDSGTYHSPLLAIQPLTNTPEFAAGLEPHTYNGARTGSVWIRTTEPKGGAKLVLKKYNSVTEAFDKVAAPLYATGHSAIFHLDRSGGGANIAAGTIYCQTNISEINSTNSPLAADFKLFRRSAQGANSIISKKIVDGWADFEGQGISFAEGQVGSEYLSDIVYTEFVLNGSAGDADTIAGAINAAGLVNIQASVDAQNRIVISHKFGGDFRIGEEYSGLLDALGFPTNSNVYPSHGNYGDFSYTVSLWEPLRFTASKDAPSTLTQDGTLWYSSVHDEVDILVHNGDGWVGYLHESSPYYNSTVDKQTDPMGPLVSATAPLTQSDGTALRNGDLWIDTSDLENFPKVYKFDEGKSGPISKKWVEQDVTDQNTQDGVLFHDARYNTEGMNSDMPGDIVDLLVSDYVDFDAPDPALYPKGMLLWNLRRSGFNVKKFVHNYVNIDDENVRYGKQSMAEYYPHRWITVSANQDDGSGAFGRKAQRKVVVQALQATINSSTDIREEARVFNLIACPGYPELIGEMVTLNYDRALTAFIVGDTPSRLLPDATSLMTWGNNLRLAVEDNDFGAPSFDEYMAMFYPWGFTSDNIGNNIVVPPSHMMLRTIALSDNVSYPWFAPAGTRRGGITNATSVGYVDMEGEFKVLALNNGQRDTLYDVKINPITFFTGVGLVNYGQKTRAKNASALDRINVARLIVYMRRQLDIIAKPYVFEPNDKITRDEIKNSVESFLLELVGQRALYDYVVVCDDTNNTPSRIDKNELYVDVAIVPVKAVEFIYIPLRIKSTGSI